MEEEEEEWYAVFISDANRTVPFLRQRSGGGCSGGDDDDGGTGCFVVWDYHVIALRRRRRAVDNSNDGDCGDDDGNDYYYEVYDYDTTLDFPCPLSTYVDLALTIPPYSRGGGAGGGALPERYRHLFRVVPADRYLAEFASDRSHMLLPPSPDGRGERYSSPPPSYPCIVASRDGRTMNLDEYIDMERHPERGTVYDLDGLARRFITVRGWSSDV